MYTINYLRDFITTRGAVADIIAIVLFLALIEAVFFIFVRFQKRKRDETLWQYTLTKKVLSIGSAASLLLFLFLIPIGIEGLIDLLIFIYMTLRWLYGIIAIFGAIFIYLFLNKKAVQKWGEVETQQEESRRLKRWS